MQRARLFAEEMHLGQRYNGASYVRGHLDHVVEVLTRFGVTDPEILAAGYLHDVLEDTPAKVDHLASKFGNGVAHLVSLVTDRKKHPTRRGRQEVTYEAMRPYPRAVIVKLADRIANVEASLTPTSESRFYPMYCAEHEFFHRTLYSKWNARDPILGGMWAHLNALVTL